MEFTISCPCGCGTAVIATDAGFTATEVTVNEPCQRMRDGAVASYTLRKSVSLMLAEQYLREGGGK